MCVVCNVYIPTSKASFFIYFHCGFCFRFFISFVDLPIAFTEVYNNKTFKNCWYITIHQENEREEIKTKYCIVSCLFEWNKWVNIVITWTKLPYVIAEKCNALNLKPRTITILLICKLININCTDGDVMLMLLVILMVMLIFRLHRNHLLYGFFRAAFNYYIYSILWWIQLNCFIVC